VFVRAALKALGDVDPLNQVYDPSIGDSGASLDTRHFSAGPPATSCTGSREICYWHTSCKGYVVDYSALKFTS
jgi:hypothetical protein